MMNLRASNLICVIALCTALFSSSLLFGRQKLDLDDVNPKEFALGAFNSYKNKLLLVSITRKSDPKFDCLPNRYIFYDYGAENYFEILAGDLKINGAYTKLLKTRILSLEGLNRKNKHHWKKMAASLMKRLNVSSETLEGGKTRSMIGNLSCWQQPVLVKIDNTVIRSYANLAVNLCQNSWCDELYWTNNDTVRLWIQIKPKVLQMVRLNTVTGALVYDRQSPLFHRVKNRQHNAPRDNLITKQNASGSHISLDSSQGKNIKLFWEKRKNGRTRVYLSRDKSDIKSAGAIKKKVVKLIQKKKIIPSLNLIKFGLWLDPGNKGLKYERLKAYISSLQINTFFDSLKNDFSDADRFSVCQKFHLEKSVRNLWKQKHFTRRFKKTCL